MNQVEPGGRSGGTAPDTGQNRDNGPEAQAARDVAALRREAERRDLPVGPTPAFEVSQLEMEADIQHVIARVEAARSQARDAGALKAEAEAEARLAEAEYDRLAEGDVADATGGTGVATGSGVQQGTGPDAAATAPGTPLPETTAKRAMSLDTFF